MRTSNIEQISNKLIEQVADYPPLPTFVNRLLLLNADPESTLTEISRVIEVEVSLVASMIRLVNSPIYGLTTPVSSIPRAIAVLGRNELMNLVLASAMFQSYKGVKHKKHYISALGYHCFKCAIATRYVGVKIGHGSGDLFLAGLVHDIGKNIIFRNVSEDVLAEVYGNYPAACDDSDAEMENFGIDHSTLGARLLAIWGFPLPLQIAVSQHHQPARKEEHFRYPLIVHAADNLIHILDAREDEEYNIIELYQVLFSGETIQALQDTGFTLSIENLSEILDELEEELSREADLAEMFS